MFDLLNNLMKFKLQIFTEAMKLREKCFLAALKRRRGSVRSEAPSLSEPSVSVQLTLLRRIFTLPSCFNEYMFIFFHCNLQRFLPLMFRPKCF